MSKKCKKNVFGDIVLVFDLEWFKIYYLFFFLFFSIVFFLLLKIWLLYIKCKDIIRYICMLYTIIWYLYIIVVNNYCVKFDFGIKLCYFFIVFDE